MVLDEIFDLEDGGAYPSTSGIYIDPDRPDPEQVRKAEEETRKFARELVERRKNDIRIKSID